MADPRAQQLLSLSHVDIADARWSDAEGETGNRFPPAFKALVETFGDSQWSDFVWVPSPFDSKYGDWRQRTLEAERISRQRFPEHYPYALHPEPGGLVPWATTDNGDVFFWITQHDPDHWPTLIKGPRAPEFEVKFSPCNLILYQVAAGTVQSAILADDAGL